MTSTPERGASPRDTDRALDELLGRVRDRAWPGPDHSPKVDAFLSEQTMTSKQPRFSKSSIAIAIAALVGGGAVATAVTHQVMTQRAKLVAEDGTEYDVVLAPTPDGAAGRFVADDGTVYGIDMVQAGQERTVQVDVTGGGGGTSTVILKPEGNGPRAVFTDEQGVEHEVDPSAADGWTQDGD